MTVKELCADTVEIRGAVTCTNMECNDEVICTGNVLIAEGLTGTGSFEYYDAMKSQFRQVGNHLTETGNHLLLLRVYSRKDLSNP